MEPGSVRELASSGRELARVMPAFQRGPVGQPARAQVVSVSAPTGGDDSVSPGTEIPAGRSIFSYNLIGGEYGLRSRLGWREWVTGLDGEVRSLPNFAGSVADGSTSRMFACTETGIWDVSASTATPTEDVVFGSQDALSGYGEHTAFTDASGNHWLIYCDETNGYYTYAETGATWTQVVRNDVGPGAGEIGGVDPADLVMPVTFANRLWFVKRDSQEAWYLPLNSLYGTAERFNFGTHFPHGGDLRCLAVWSIGGGDSIAARLIAVSGGGDVVIYEGIDPADADTFRIVGTWYVGAVPVGRRLATNIGGDVAIMSSQGILPVSKLVLSDPNVERSVYSTVQIANRFNQLQADTANLRGWTMRLHPKDAALMVLVPVAVGQSSTQLAMSMITRGWHQYRDLPMGLCAEPWGGTLYFGTTDGRVCVNDGVVDGVTLADPNSYSRINWSLLTAYSNAGTPLRKRVQQIRVRILSQGGAIPVNAEARYDLDLSEADAPSALSATGTDVWDAGLWDQAKWAGAYQVQTKTFGACGSGHVVALAIRGSTSSRMTLVNMDATLEVGGWR